MTKMKKHLTLVTWLLIAVPCSPNVIPAFMSGRCISEEESDLEQAAKNKKGIRQY